MISQKNQFPICKEIKCNTLVLNTKKKSKTFLQNLFNNNYIDKGVTWQNWNYFRKIHYKTVQSVHVTRLNKRGHTGDFLNWLLEKIRNLFCLKKIYNLSCHQKYMVCILYCTAASKVVLGTTWKDSRIYFSTLFWRRFMHTHKVPFVKTRRICYGTQHTHYKHFLMLWMWTTNETA